MENYERELSQIQRLLKENPKGLTVTDISREIGVNRNSVAKYLDVLQISGHLEMRSIGPAKMYFPAQRVPISAMLNFSSDAILVLDSRLRILRMNERCCRLVPGDYAGKPVEELPLPPLREARPRLIDALDGIESKADCSLEGMFFTIRIIPTIFDDNTRGVTVIMEDVTEQRMALEEIRASEAKLRIITNHLPAAVWATDANLRVRTMYGSALKRLGWDREQMTGRTLYELLDADEPQEAIAAHRKALQGEPSHYELHARGRMYAAKVEPLRSQQGRIVGCVGLVFDITEERHAQERLRQTAADIAALDEISRRLACAGTDYQETFRIITEGVAKAIGDKCSIRLLSEDGQMLERVALYHPDDAVRAVLESINERCAVGKMPFIAHAIRTGEAVLLPVVPEEKIFLHVPPDLRVDSRLGRYSLLIAPLRVGGRVIGVLAVSRDHAGDPYTADDRILLQELADRASFAIERKHAEEELQRSRDELSVILASIGDGVLVQDHAGQPVFVNDAFARALGFQSAAELRGKPVESIAAAVDFIDADGNPLPFSKLPGRQVLAGAPEVTALLKARLEDGQLRLLDVCARPVRDAQGNVAMAVSVVRDVTAERQTQQLILESEHRYRTLIETSLDGIAIVGRDLGIRFASPRLLEMLDHGELRGDENAASFIAPEDLPRLHGDLRRLLESGRQVNTEYALLRSDGGRIAVEINSSLLPGEEEILVSVRDVTERQRVRRELERRLLQQQLAAALGEKALREAPLQELMETAAAMAAKGLSVEYAQVLELLPGKEAVLLRAGVGWKEGLVGRATVSAGLDSQAGFTLSTDQPVIVRDLRAETRFSGPALLHDHDVVSGLSVVISVPSGPWGVLGAHTAHETVFTKDDIAFLQSVANILGSAIAHHQDTQAQRTLAEQLRLQRERLDGIIASVPGVVWDAWGRPDEQGQRINYVSEYVERMLGYTVEEWLATPNFWLTIVHPEDRERAAREAEAIFSSRRGGVSQFRWVTKDGRAIPVEAQSTVVCDAQGNPVGMRGVTMAIAHRT